jgi:hypothetical protein
MLDRFGILELYQTGFRHRVNGIAGRIGHEMKMKAAHAIHDQNLWGSWGGFPPFVTAGYHCPFAVDKTTASAPGKCFRIDSSTAGALSKSTRFKSLIPAFPIRTRDPKFSEF